MHRHAKRAAAQPQRGAARLQSAVPDGEAGWQPFRNLFGPLGPGEAFRGYGLEADADVARTQRMLARLARKMERGHLWQGPVRSGLMPSDNPEIPSGYTYLAQLVAHDLSFASVGAAKMDGSPLGDPNHRTPSLDLDTLYGGGPLDQPTSYMIEANRRAGRRFLRIGLPVGPGRPERLYGRDLPRVRCPYADEAGTGLDDVLICDARNDDNPLVAQITVLFTLLHNHVCTRLAGDAIPGSAFERARAIVTKVYRTIVVEDLLRRLLVPAVYDHYAAGGPAPDGGGDARLPVEFSHAAFRVGHVMIRAGYHFGADEVFGLPDVLLMNSTDRPGAMPLPSSWIVRWSDFFDLGPAPPRNLSRRIAPSIVRSLAGDTASATGDAAAEDSLLYKDLRRGASGQMRSVASLIEKLPPGIREGSRLLRDGDARRKAIRAWAKGGAVPLPGDDAETLAADPPLLFFIMFEAAAEQDGLRLGHLGSTILGEVCARLAAPSTDDPVEAEIFPQGAPRSMPELIRFLETACGLGEARMPFV